MKLKDALLQTGTQIQRRGIHKLDSLSGLVFDIKQAASCTHNLELHTQPMMAPGWLNVVHDGEVVHRFRDGYTKYAVIDVVAQCHIDEENYVVVAV